MPTYTYEERLSVCREMETKGSCACPRCGAAVQALRLQTTQDKVLKRPGKPLYRCGNNRCLCECTPVSYMTIPPPSPPPPPPKT